MSDILSVCLQDFLYSRKPELRDPLLHLFYLKVTGIPQNAPEGAFCRVIKDF